MSTIATSVATVSLSGSLDEKMRAIADAGFDGFEVFEPDLISSPDLPEDIAKKAADLGLTLDLYQPSATQTRPTRNSSPAISFAPNANST